MRYYMLKKMRDNLIAKTYKTREEQMLLEELISLGKMLDIETASLAMSGKRCPTCGAPL